MGLPEKVYPELLMARLVTATWPASIEIDQAPSAPPNTAPFKAAVVLVCVQATSPLPLFQTVFPLVVSQLPLAGSTMAPLLVLPASQISCAAEARLVPKVKQTIPRTERAAIRNNIWLFIED